MRKLFVFIGLLTAMSLASPLLAADAPGYGVTIGGQVKMDTAWQVLGKDQMDNESDDTLINFFANLQSESYLAATFSSADKITGAYIEIGAGGFTNTGNSGGVQDNPVYLRYAYGWWNVGSCKLLVGQFDGSLGDGGALQAIGNDKSGKSGLAGFGFIGATRDPKLALEVEANDNVSFMVAIGQAASQNTGFDAYTNQPAINGAASTSNYLPRLEAVVNFTLEDFSFGLGAGISWEKYKAISSPAADAVDDTALSYLLWIPVSYANGPFSVLLNAYYGQNVDSNWNGMNNAEYEPGSGFFPNGVYAGQPTALPAYDGDSLESTKSWGIGIDFNFALTEQLTLGVGGGLTHLSNDAWNGGNSANEDSYTRWAAYVALPYQVTDNFTIQPEIGYYNYGDAVGTVDEDAGHEWLLGVHFQFLF